MNLFFLIKNMISRNKLYKIFYGKNYDSLYSGISGFFFLWAHKNLQSFIISEKKSNKILEIGPGRFPHYNFDKQKFLNKYYFYEKNPKNISYLKNNKDFFFFKSMKSIPNFFFDRIICSHVLEHVEDPVKFILKLKSFLKKGGHIYFTLPCDPGLLWNFVRLVRYLLFWKKKGIRKREYYYFMALEHKNSIQNLLSILKYHFNEVEEVYLPSRLKLININLMCNVIVRKN